MIALHWWYGLIILIVAPLFQRGDGYSLRPLIVLFVCWWTALIWGLVKVFS